MKKKILLSIAIAFISITGLTAQKIYELNEVKQIPFIIGNDIQEIALSVVELYKNAIITPERYSSEDAVKNTVYTFYEADDKMNKTNPCSGMKYSADNKNDIDLNNELLFNLTFDENGNMIIPDKIFVVSFRVITENKINKQVGLLSFELKVNDSIKMQLKQVSLKTIAEVDKNSLSGGLTPIKILIPFKLSYNTEFDTEYATVVKRNGMVDALSDGNCKKEQLIEMLKDNIELSKFKKGVFRATIEEKKLNIYIDFNIERGMFWSPQTKSFSISTFSIKSIDFQRKI